MQRQSVAGYPVLGNDATVLLAVLHLARGETEAAGDAVDRLLMRIDRAPRTKRAFYLHAAGRALALLGRRVEATEVLGKLMAAMDDLPLTYYLRAHLEGHIALMDDRHADASVALDRAAEIESVLPIALTSGSSSLLRARLLLEEGRTDAVVTAVTPILEEWDNTGNLGRVLLDGPAILPALRYAAQAGDSIADRASSFFSGRPIANRIKALASQAERLTPREREVLDGALLLGAAGGSEDSERLFDALGGEVALAEVAYLGAGEPVG